MWKAVGIMGRGCLNALIGNSREAIPMIVEGLTAYRSTGSRLWIAETLTYLAKAQLDAGPHDDALHSTDEALSIIETTKEMWYQAEVHRMAGEIAVRSRKPHIAEEHFERALATARRQEAKLLELRAATSMARPWRDQDKRQRAHDLLAPIYNWFTEGFDTRDLKEAKTLLEE
jgi:predicted ATPase